MAQLFSLKLFLGLYGKRIAIVFAPALLVWACYGAVLR
jgi:hypothetical protein